MSLNKFPVEHWNLNKDSSNKCSDSKRGCLGETDTHITGEQWKFGTYVMKMLNIIIYYLLNKQMFLINLLIKKMYEKKNMHDKKYFKIRRLKREIFFTMSVQKKFE